MFDITKFIIKTTCKVQNTKREIKLSFVKENFIMNNLLPASPFTFLAYLGPMV